MLTPQKKRQFFEDPPKTPLRFIQIQTNRVLRGFLDLPESHVGSAGSSGGGAWPVDAVNRSKLLCLAKARDLHGAGGLPAPW